MNLREINKNFTRRLFRRMGYHLHRISNEDRLAIENYERHLSNLTLESIFGSKISRLEELIQRYSRVDLPISNHSIWDTSGKSTSRPEAGRINTDLRIFRGHNKYIASHTGSDILSARLKYYIFAEAVKRKDSMCLLQVLHEDGAFGCINFEYPGVASVSRDLLDSVVELNFLHKQLNVLARDDLRVLDIGAGYGRMAHRMLEANPRIRSYTCVDAIPESTFLCEFYLQHRGIQDRVNVVPLDKLEQVLKPDGYDLALNIHSFSECTYAAIEWWLTQLKSLRVRNLMIVPNDPLQFLSTEVDRSRRDYAPLLQGLGYTLIAQEPVFSEAAVQELLGVRDNMFLFEQREKALPESSVEIVNSTHQP